MSKIPGSLGFLTRVEAALPGAMLTLSALGFALGCGASENGPEATALHPGHSPGSGGAPEAGPASSSPPPDASTGPVAAPPDAGFSFPSDSTVCEADLPFKPPGCPCMPGSSAACWTGPMDARNMGDCKDGVQQCIVAGEFSTWGPCEGAVLDCGMPPPDPPPDECPCVPGTVIGCDEDCEALVICAPFSTKECQPDGKFGPCRESLLPTADTNLFGCVNLFHGCFAENPDGIFSGDCSQSYTCGHPPGGSVLSLLP